MSRAGAWSESKAVINEEGNDLCGAGKNIRSKSLPAALGVWSERKSVQFESVVKEEKRGLGWGG